MIKEESRFSDSCLFEGMVSISAILNSQLKARTIEKVLFCEEQKKKKEKELNFLIKASKTHGFEIEFTDKDSIDRITTGSSHGGIVAFCSERKLTELTENDILENGFYVYIEGIEDPYNFGYAVRSIYASGADGIILSARNWMSAAGVVCRASAGASELIPIYTDSGECASLFKNKGYKIVCADTKNAVSVYCADLKKPIFLVIGGEKRGISNKILSLADTTVRLEYGRDFKKSLSAASAAAILAFEVYRSNRIE